MCSARLVWLTAAVLLVGGARLGGGGPAPRQVRIGGPDVLQRATRHLVHAEGLYDGKSWKRLAPDQFTVKVTGAGRAAVDPAGRPMNPFEVRCDDVAAGKLTVE